MKKAPELGAFFVSSRHCERSEAIQLLCNDKAEGSWIASLRSQ